MAQSSSTIIEPNPGDGKVPKSNWLHLALLVGSIPMICLQVISRRTLNFSHNKITFRKDLILSILRRFASLPLPLIRHLTIPKAEKVLNAPRFRSKNSNLFERVLQRNVAGYWLCKGAAGKPVDPASCDLVIYYLHGGAYISGHPQTWLIAALRTAALAAERGISVSCFALEYSLAPEAKFPTQVDQAVAGYQYLLDQKIDASKIAVFGESAGAHLSLCLCASLGEAKLPKPGRGIFLESPWIDLKCSRRATWERNKYLDFLDLGPVLVASKHLLGDYINPEAAELADFTLPPSGGRSWKDILPSRVWISAGSHETLLYEIAEFYKCLEKDGVKAQFEVEEGAFHCWQGIKDAFDVEKYLNSTEGSLPEGLMVGTTVLANAILSGIEAA